MLFRSDHNSYNQDDINTKCDIMTTFLPEEEKGNTSLLTKNSTANDTKPYLLLKV